MPAEAAVETLLRKTRERLMVRTESELALDRAVKGCILRCVCNTALWNGKFENVEVSHSMAFTNISGQKLERMYVAAMLVPAKPQMTLSKNRMAKCTEWSERQHSRSLLLCLAESRPKPRLTV